MATQPELAPIVQPTKNYMDAQDCTKLGDQSTLELTMEMRDSKRPLALLTAIFVVSRLFCFALGIRFDISPLTSYLQYLDPVLLRTDLLRSLFYLREQPPGFNLFLGLVLKFSPFGPQVSFHAVYLAMGLASVLCLYCLLIRLGIETWPAVAGASIFMLAPTTILYENWLFYAYPVTFLFNLAAFELHRFAVERKTRDGVIFFCGLAIVSSFHSMYHLLWLLLIASVLAILFGSQWRKVLVAACIPAALLMAIYVKNFVVFGEVTPGARSFQTTNYALMVSLRTPPDIIAKMVAEGKITRVLQMVPYAFVPPDYRDMVPEPPRVGIPALDEPVKSTGANNWNSNWMGQIGALYKKDAVTVNKYYPRALVKSILANLARYFWPADYDIFPFESTFSNVAVFRSISRVYNIFITGQLGTYRYPWIVWIGISATTAFGIWTAGKWAMASFKGRSAWTDPFSVCILFLIFNVIYEATVSILFSHGDQNRYRDSLAGHFAVFYLLLMQSAWLLLKRRYATAKSEPVAIAPGSRQAL